MDTTLGALLALAALFAPSASQSAINCRIDAEIIKDSFNKLGIIEKALTGVSRNFINYYGAEQHNSQYAECLSKELGPPYIVKLREIPNWHYRITWDKAI